MKNITKIMAMILSVLIAVTALPMAVFAEELSALAENSAVVLTTDKTYEDITNVLTVKYCLEDIYSWYYLPSGTSLDHINGIWLWTGEQDFYLKYRSKNNGVGWLPQVLSTENDWDDFAGSANGAMTNLSIEVYTMGGTRLYDDYVVMYRAKVAGEWLEWVSNGTPTAMETIKSEYGLSGSLDTASTNAGWASRGNIQQLEVKMYKKVGATYSGNVNGNDFEEITGNVPMYYRKTSSSTWENLNNGVATFDQMEGLLLQTSPSCPYYFSYAAKDATHGWNSYVSSRKSGTYDYAGYTYPVTNIGIRVYAYNTRVYDNYVVMYRAKAEDMNGWLDWVSNATPEVMYAIKSAYGLDGGLDTSSTDAGDSRYGHITALEIRVYRRKDLTVKPGTNATVISDVPYINQYEKNFPNGCESASTVMALQYLVGSDKISFEDFVNNYLDKTSVTPVKYGIGPDPNEVYMGDPWGNESAWGCFSPVIMNAVKKLETGLGVHATSLTGHSFSEFTQYIDRGIPVIIWGRVDMGGVGNVWTWTTPAGKSISYPGNLHCLLLIGYDSNYYYFNDPMREANIGYTKASVEAAYKDLQKQAIVIELGSSPSGSATVKPIADTVVTKEKEIEKTPALSDEYHADPIDLSTGAHVIDNTLLSIDGAKTLSFSVSYRSDLLTDSSVGRGWSHNYEKRVEYDSENDRIYVYDNATYYAVYEKAEGADVYTTETVTKDNYTVTKSSSGYTVNCNYAKSEYYDTEGRLVKLVDKGGLATVLTYGDNTVTVTDEVSGKYLVLTKTDGKVTSVSDSSGRTVTIGYVDGSLGSITDENGNVLSYSYNEVGQIEKGRDKNGTVFFTDEYDSLGRVVRQTDAADLGNVTVIEYTGFGDSELSIVAVTDRTGACTVYKYNDKKQLVSKTDPLGNTATYEYDEKGHLTKKTDAKGNSDVNVYDGNGNLVSATDKLGCKTEFTYDARNNLTKITYADGSLVIYTYDTNDRLISMRDLRGTVTAFEYNGQGLLSKKTVGQRQTQYEYTAGRPTKTTDALGRVTLNNYDSAGRLVKTTDCQNKETAYAYDAAGNLLSVTDANGNVTANEYNAEGEIVKSTDAKGNVTVYTYNGNGKRTSITLPGGGTVRYEYDKEDRLTKTVYPNGSATVNVYDAAGRTVSSSDRNGNVTAYEYDTVGNVTKITSPLGGITLKEYDAEGRVTKITEVVDPVDELPEDLFFDDDADPTTQYNVTTCVYDGLGRMVKTVNALGGETVYTYNGAGDVLTVKDPVGNTTVNTYNGYGELISVCDPRGNTTRYTYDGIGNLLTVKNALDQVTTNTYDSLNRLTAVTDPGGHTVSYEYDALGRNTKITNAKGKATVTDYDALGNIVKITNALGHVDYAAVYDSMGQITEVTDSAGSKTTYQYDLMGNVTKQTDALGYSYNYTYDNSGNMVSSIDKSGKISYSTYDGMGNVTSVTGPTGAFTDYLYDTAGRMATSTSSTYGDDNMYTYNALGLIDRRWDKEYFVTKYNYDAAGRITSFTNSNGTTSYTYDANGNVLTSTDGTGTVTREYDALNRVTKYTDIYGNVIRYEYNACGELVRMTYPTGEVGIYSYDANHNMVLSGMQGEDRNTTYEYNDLDKVKKVTNVDGSVITRSYDSAGRLQVVNERTKSGQFITACIYTYDAMGRIIQEIDPIGLTTYSMTYDSMGRLITRTETDTRDNSVIGSETFTYDGAGNIISDGDGNTYEYGDNNKLTKYNNTLCTSTVKGSTSTYVQNGNTYSVTYDARNRLQKINGSYNQYWYDADNNRINMYYYSTNMQYTYDCADGRSRLVWSNDHTSTVTTYAYGAEGLLWSRANGTYQVYHYDYRGSVVAVSDIDGNITDTLEYDAYGSISERTGTSKLIFTYNGQYGVLTDPNGLLYMRTRYYSPTYKRFMSEDVVYGNITDSTSLNRYSYVNGDPISFVDPFGLSKESGGNNSKETNKVLGFDYDPNVSNYLGWMLDGREIVTRSYNYVQYGFNVQKNGHYAIIKGSRSTAALKQDIYGTRYAFSNARNYPNVFEYVKPSIAGAEALKPISGGSVNWGSVLGYSTVALDVGLNIYDNIQDDTRPQKIVTDAIVDTTFGVGSIYASASIGAAIGSLVPGVGNIVGAVTGFAAGAMIYFATDIITLYDKTAVDYAKDGLAWIGDSIVDIFD